MGREPAAFVFGQRMTAPQGQPTKRMSGAIARARRPNRDDMECLRLGVPYWFMVAVLVTISTFQIWMNPFGFSDLVQRYSQDVSDLLITGPYFYGTEGRDNVSVAIVDENTLHTLNSPWPWKYGDHARVLDALLQYKPKAVVVDFLFVDSRPDETLKDLVAEIGRYRKAGVPIYFEGGIDLPYGENPLRPELAKTGVPVIDPSIPINSGVARQYNATGRCFNQNPDAQGNCPSLALRVYRDLYGKKYPPAPVNDMMELVWGTRTAPENHWITRSDASGDSHSCFEDMNLLRRWYLAFFNTSVVKSPCPYTAEFPVDGMLLQPDDKDVVKMATNRVIFYGGALQGAQDRVYTPVNDLLPGVFVHAMAMDNLITFRGHPFQNAISLGGKPVDGNLVQIVATIPVILILSLIHWRSVRRKRLKLCEPARERSVTFEYFFDKAVEKVWHYLAFGLALGVGLLLTRSAGLSVANWVEVVFVSVELAAMLLVGLPDSIWGYLHHVAGGQLQAAPGPALDAAEERVT
ncbi:MAG: CHASE2 domain-containing protein [Alphaproteobacteria bacterium]|nr:CHASE2 domain-containing protein [Alphaproteobacteria bacterium]